MSEQLKELNRLMVFFGRVPETHIKAMSGYPGMFFSDIKKASLNYNIATKKDEPSWVHYDIEFSKENDKLKERFAFLQDAIQKLFWKEIEVKLYIDGKEFINE